MADTDTTTTDAPAGQEGTPGSEGADTTAADAGTDAPPADATVDNLWNEVKRLRKESGGYRTERNQARDDLGRFTSAFEGTDEATRDTILNLPKALREDAKGTAAWLKEQADEILAQFDAAAQRASDDGEDMPVSRAEIKKMLAEQAESVKHQQAVDQQLVAINAQAKELGYDEGSRGYRMLLIVAADETNGDLAKADELIKADRQKIIDDNLAALRGGANNSARTPPQAGVSRQEKPIPKGFGADFSQFVREQIAGGTQ